MPMIQPVNIRSFKQRAKRSKSRFRRFLSKLEKDPPKGLQQLILQSEKELWREVDCLTCANCCKTMTPTFSNKDIKRISAHLGQTEDEFKKNYLRRERGGDRDWLNKVEPCQFLDMKTNMCSIYEVRPDDCAGYPHLRKNFKSYGHIYKQNVECCPAAYKLVEKMIMKLEH
jgi:Fe-S-cluster containining protein